MVRGGPQQQVQSGVHRFKPARPALRPRLSGLRKGAGESWQDRFVSRDTVPMPERMATCGDCGASMTFPAGGWEEVQRSAIDAWAKAHELAAHEGKSVSGWVLDPNPARDRD